MDKDSFLSFEGNIYLVIGKTVWEQDMLAQQVAPQARIVTIRANDYAIISLEPYSVPDMLAYMDSLNGQYEFEWNAGNGKASFLTHPQILDLLATAE